ncbi:aspartate aminotransferase family protein [Castellaniella sp.]|uniref:aspartate aminotransferase family protein n=1 Tax=Castellaniella sp. TaxID=1955812 RepID=UPI003561C80E
MNTEALLSGTHAFNHEMQKVVPGAVNSNIRLKPPKVVFRKAEGAYLWDVDGHMYVDYVLGQGPAFMGHANRHVNRAVAAAVQDGMVFGATASIELDAAKILLRALEWPEVVRFGMTGTEVDQAALRIARAVTGRTRFIRFEGHYHGWLDNVLSLSKNGQSLPASKGQVPEHLTESEMLPWNDLDALEQCLRERPNEFAAVIMEPVMVNNGAIEPVEGYLQGVRALCDQYGVVLIFDEIITGFRIHRQGAYGRYGVKPDLATYGKAVAGGWPVAVLAGSQEILKEFGTGVVNHSGTFNGSIMACAAVIAAQEYLDMTQPYDRVTQLGLELQGALDQAAGALGLPWRSQGLGPLFHTGFGAPGVMKNYADVAQLDNAGYEAFRAYLAFNGIWTTTRGTWYVSCAHTQDDVQLTLDRFEKAVRQWQRSGGAG